MRACVWRVRALLLGCGVLCGGGGGGWWWRWVFRPALGVSFFVAVGVVVVVALGLSFYARQQQQHSRAPLIPPSSHTHSTQTHHKHNTGVDAKPGRGTAREHRAQRQVEPRRPRPERLRRLHVERRRHPRPGECTSAVALPFLLCLLRELPGQARGSLQRSMHACNQTRPAHAWLHRRSCHRRAGRSAPCLARFGS